MLHVCSQDCGPRDAVKDRLNDQQRAMSAISQATASLIPESGCIGHRGRTGSGYKEVHCDYRYNKPVPDIEGEMILEHTLAYDLLLCNMCLKIRSCHLITDRSGNTARVISKGPVTDVMVISVKKVVLQPSAGKRHVD